MHRPPAPDLPLLATALEAWRRVPTLVAGAWGAILIWILASAAAVQTGLGGLHGAAAVLSLVGWGAMLRLGVSGSVADAKAQGLGPFGLQVRRTELRLLGAFLLGLLCWLIVVTVLALVVLALFGGAELSVEAIQARDWGAVGPLWRVAVLAAATIGALSIALGLAARLTLAGPATVAEDRMVSVLALRLSRGRAVGLTLCLLLGVAPVILLLVLGAVVLPPDSYATVATVLLIGLGGPVLAALVVTIHERLSREG